MPASAAPIVLPPAVAIVPGLVVHGLVERIAALVWPTGPEELFLRVPAR